MARGCDYCGEEGVYLYLNEQDDHVCADCDDDEHWLSVDIDGHVR